jgi:hypothetical protein
MIHYQLRCEQSHGFDGWFNDSASFEKQAKRGLIECPQCGDTNIERALMAPALTGRRAPLAPIITAEPPAVAALPEAVAALPEKAMVRMPAKMLAALQRMRAEVEKNCDYVGPGFADQARAMHRGETEPKAIYGEATDEQAESLTEEGVAVGRIPWVPRADG